MSKVVCSFDYNIPAFFLKKIAGAEYSVTVKATCAIIPETNTIGVHIGGLAPDLSLISDWMGVIEHCQMLAQEIFNQQQINKAA
ncbi:hypothetical protein PDL71_15245 [Lacibacter sp. MH-610]|uniref:hypothetical protein n=1 Tax=Lacibacter sp. MH-610 TaxID=3020883 RepID=UPI003891B5F3